MRSTIGDAEGDIFEAQAEMAADPTLGDGASQLVADELMSDRIDWWVLESATDLLLGFVGFANDSIEGLFIDPNHRGQGAGSALVAHAQRLAVSSLAVDVNEQNDDAVGFYASLGFSVVGRSPTDGGGRPFPLLHMTRPSLP